MQSCDVIIVGGGPAGSSAAWELVRGGADVLVLDKERFPRLKLCAGWITPEVLRDLELDADSYPHRMLTFRRLCFRAKGMKLNVPCLQHSIRRYEFDDWLLSRTTARVVQHNVRDIRREGNWYVIDDAFRCRYLVGAGGTRCPVYRTLFRNVHARSKELQIVTLEHEFPCNWRDPDCHLWFFDEGLPGYSWYVPKEHGWLNVGVGGLAERIKQRGQDIKNHWAHLAQVLNRELLPQLDVHPGGYSYYLRGKIGTVRLENAFVTGDAVGLATWDMGEGIGPAIRSGLRAAQAILHGRPYRLDDLAGTSLPSILFSRLRGRQSARVPARA